MNSYLAAMRVAVAVGRGPVIWMIARNFNFNQKSKAKVFDINFYVPCGYNRMTATETAV